MPQTRAAKWNVFDSALYAKRGHCSALMLPITIGSPKKSTLIVNAFTLCSPVSPAYPASVSGLTPPARKSS